MFSHITLIICTLFNIFTISKFGDWNVKCTCIFNALAMQNLSLGMIVIDNFLYVKMCRACVELMTLNNQMNY